MKLFSAWAEAWCAAMAEAGYPHAYLVPGNTEHDYAWNPDVDRFYELLVQEDWTEHDKLGWNAAHRAFVLVDQLRPDFILPSPQLANLLVTGKTIGGKTL